MGLFRIHSIKKSDVWTHFGFPVYEVTLKKKKQYVICALLLFRITEIQQICTFI